MLVLIGCDAQEPHPHAAARAILPMSVLLKNLRTGGGSRSRRGRDGVADTTIDESPAPRAMCSSSPDKSSSRFASMECSPCPSASQAEELQSPGRSTSSVPRCS